MAYPRIAQHGKRISIETAFHSTVENAQFFQPERLNYRPWPQVQNTLIGDIIQTPIGFWRPYFAA
jgi:hypothetical protein